MPMLCPQPALEAGGVGTAPLSLSPARTLLYLAALVIFSALPAALLLVPCKPMEVVPPGARPDWWRYPSGFSAINIVLGVSLLVLIRGAFHASPGGLSYPGSVALAVALWAFVGLLFWVSYYV
jgi:hypothetical protein